MTRDDDMHTCAETGKQQPQWRSKSQWLSWTGSIGLTLAGCGALTFHSPVAIVDLWAVGAALSLVAGIWWRVPGVVGAILGCGVVVALQTSFAIETLIDTLTVATALLVTRAAISRLGVSSDMPRNLASLASFLAVWIATPAILAAVVVTMLTFVRDLHGSTPSETLLLGLWLGIVGTFLAVGLPLLCFVGPYMAERGILIGQVATREKASTEGSLTHKTKAAIGLGSVVIFVVMASLITIHSNAVLFCALLTLASLTLGFRFAVISTAVLIITGLLGSGISADPAQTLPWVERLDLLIAGLLVIGAGRLADDHRAENGRRNAAENEARRNEQFVRTVFDHSPVGISVRDRFGKLLLHNRAWKSIWNVSEEDLRDYQDREREKLSFDYRDSYLGKWQRGVEKVYSEGGGFFVPEIKIESTRKGGRIRWISQYFSAIKGADGQVDRVTILTVDITERRIAEEALRRSEERFRTLWLNLPVPMFRSTPSGQILSVNPATVELFRAESEEQMLATPSREFYDDPDSRQEFVSELEESGSLDNTICRMKRYDGTVFWATSTVRAERDADGQIVWYDGVMKDISDYIEAEAALQASEQRYRTLVDKARVAIIEDDKDGQITYANRRFANLFGYDISEIEPLTISDLIHPDDRAFVMSRHAERYDSGESLSSYEFKGLTKDRRTVFLEVHVDPLVQDGRVVGSRSFLWDVTDSKEAEARLQESEQRYRSLYESAGEGILVIQEGAIVLANPKIEEVSGYRAETLKGRSFLEFVHPEDRNRASEYYLERLGGTKEPTGSDPVRYLHASGQVRWIDAKSRVIEWDGSPAILSFVADITESRETVQALAESEEKFRLLSEQSQLGIFIVQDDIVVYANQAASTLCGATRESLTGQDFRYVYSLVHPSDVSQAMEHLRSSKNPGAQERGAVTFRLLTTTGESRWVEQYVKPVVYSGYRARFVTFVDVTERVESVKQLNRLSAAVQQSANMISIVDLDGTVDYVNPEYSAVTGYSSEELVGYPSELLGNASKDPNLRNQIWQAVGTGRTWTGTVFSRRKGQDMFWQRVTVSPIEDDAGDIIGCLTVGEDMTREIVTQQKLADSDKMSAVGTLAAGVAHEFRNYLAGMIGNASFAREELEQDADIALARETLDQIVEIGEKANELTLSLLSYSRAGAKVTKPENLAAIVENTLKLVRKEMQVRSVRLVTQLDEVPLVEVNSSKIQQVLINLLINAQQAIKVSGVVTVTLERAGNSAEIKVSDTGTGISPENLGKVFDPFFSTKGVWGEDEPTGTGMGLSICRNIAREHGGDLTVVSTPGAGSTFRLTLPIERTSVEIAHDPVAIGRPSVICFSLDDSVVEEYREQATQLGWPFRSEASMMFDRADSYPANSLVICDAQFVGKLELIRMAETCASLNVPYILVNLGGLDYELEELFQSAAAKYENLPMLQSLRSTTTAIDPV